MSKERLTALEDVAVLATVGATYPELMLYLQAEIAKCEAEQPTQQKPEMDIYKYTNVQSGYVEYSADEDKYGDERIAGLVRKEHIQLRDAEYLAEQPAQQEPVTKDSRDCPYCYHTGAVHCGDVKDKILANGGDVGYCSNAQIYGRRTPQPAQQETSNESAYQRGYLDGMAKPCVECADRKLKEMAKHPSVQQEADLSGLKPTTQEVVKGWIEDGTFIQRAIGAMQEQEAENMRLEKMVAPQPAQRTWVGLSEKQLMENNI